tara:strand:+ start:49 stop:462 length:414 start_codon:yes stop_codon:yes gene_type:complete
MQLDLFEDEPTPQKEDTRTCRICKEQKPSDLFQSTTGGKAKQRVCKSCFKYQYKKVKQLRETVALPNKDYLCPICKRGEKELKNLEKTKSTVWSFDHCWETLTFRGWLCHRCNRGLGFFTDDKQSLLNAAAYLGDYK